MNPVVVRALILAAELMIFFIATAFTSYFVSHASAWQHAEGETPPAAFPVIAYEGESDPPRPQNYFVVSWSEWTEVAKKRPRATLVLPERSARVKIGEAGDASFISSEEPGPRHAVELTWRTGAGEQVARYVAYAGSIEPRYLRTLGTQTLLMGAVVGFIVGLLVGRALRRRWLVRPAYAVPPSK